MFPHRFFEGEGLPRGYADGEWSVTFRTDFRCWLKYEYLQSCTNLTAEEKLASSVRACLEELPPGTPPSFIMDAQTWFHSCADCERRARITVTGRMAEHAAKRPRTFCLFWDFYQVWASFKKQHQIDLYTCGPLHWWEFRRLLDELEPDTPLPALRRLRGLTRAEFMQDEAGLKRKRADDWARAELDKLFAALPE